MTIVLGQLEQGLALPDLKKTARNTAAASKGSIHDDEEARKRGFAGGFVPGGTSLAYITQLLVDTLGPSYLDTGRLKLQFARPVYSGEEITVKGTVTSVAPEENGRRVHVDVWIENHAGDRCVRGTASVRIPAS